MAFNSGIKRAQLCLHTYIHRCMQLYSLMDAIKLALLWLLLLLLFFFSFVLLSISFIYLFFLSRVFNTEACQRLRRFTSHLNFCSSSRVMENNSPWDCCSCVNAWLDLIACNFLPPPTFIQCATLPYVAWSPFRAV